MNKIVDPEPRDFETFTSFIGGEGLAPAGEAQPLIDPSTGRRWGSAHVDPAAVDRAVASASAAFASARWQALTPAERGALLGKLADLVFANAEKIGRLESLANGKSHAATTAEFRATAQWYRYFASAAETMDDTCRPVTGSSDAFILREPLGVVVAITPFNGAASLGSWKLAPALAMGNAVILKPPAEAPGSSILLARLVIEAGFPAGLVNVVVADVPLSERLALHPDVAMVSFTGSTTTARLLGAKVSGELKRFVCEAGGKSAHIVFEDADLGDAVIAATQGAFSATGQTCVAGSRIFVHVSLYDEFLKRFVESARRIRLGPPASPQSHLGPVASRRQWEKIKGFVDDTLAAGGRALLGGRPAQVAEEYSGGFWFEPTILVDVTGDMRICREEVFGPVVTVLPFETEEEVVARANETPFGLAAGFWTKDIRRVRRMARRLQAGTVWVNTYRANNARVPFGGYKQSGIGRENGVEAMIEFSQLKSVVIEHGPAADPFAN